MYTTGEYKLFYPDSFIDWSRFRKKATIVWLFHAADPFSSARVIQLFFLLLNLLLVSFFSRWEERLMWLSMSHFVQSLERCHRGNWGRRGRWREEELSDVYDSSFFPLLCSWLDPRQNSKGNACLLLLICLILCNACDMRSVSEERMTWRERKVDR